MKRAIAMGAAMFCVTAPSVLQGQGTKSVAPSTSAYEQRRMEMSLFRGTNALRQLAKLHGGSYTYEEPAQRGWLQYHIADLTQESQTIVIGAPGLSKAVLSSDGNRVETEYQVRVEKTLKGSVRPGDIFTVRLPGGKYAFDDGSAAELKTPEFQRMLIGNRYLIFSRLDGGNTNVLTAGPQGLFEISRDGSAVKSHARENVDLVTHDVKDKSEQTLLSEIEEAKK